MKKSPHAEPPTHCTINAAVADVLLLVPTKGLVNVAAQTVATIADVSRVLVVVPTQRRPILDGGLHSRSPVARIASSRFVGLPQRATMAIYQPILAFVDVIWLAETALVPQSPSLMNGPVAVPRPGLSGVDFEI